MTSGLEGFNIGKSAGMPTSAAAVSGSEQRAAPITLFRKEIRQENKRAGGALFLLLHTLYRPHFAIGECNVHEHAAGAPILEWM